MPLAALIVLALLVAMTGAVADQAVYGHQVKWCALKTVETLDSIGTGLSVELFPIAEDWSLWFDSTLLYDGVTEQLGAFGGLSTEIEKFPVLNIILKPMQTLSNNLLDRAGFGYSTQSQRLLWYVTVDF